jgi:glycosyltransferase involved in cell wall biosynthesis
MSGDVHATASVETAQKPVNDSAFLANVLLLGWMIAGNRTHFEMIQDVVLQSQNIRPRVRAVHAFLPGGVIESLPLPATLRSHLRVVLECASAYTPGAIDVAWTSSATAASILGLRKRLTGGPPLVITADSTPAQLASMAPYYRPPGPRWRRAVRHVLTLLQYRSADVVNPWSCWAAESFVREYGVAPERIQVVPPGTDLSLWHPAPDASTRSAQRVRLLFVGADFERKGGDLLVDVFQKFFADTCELHLVTKHAVGARPGIQVYRDFAPNDERLRALYASSDILVLPTRADCFSLASIEAMASGLPVITTSVGGIPEIVVDGETGILIPPGDALALRQAIQQLVDHPDRRGCMGRAGRQRAERRFDGVQNARRLVAILRDTARRSIRGTERQGYAVH